MVSVVMSRATRVPCFNLDLSSLDLDPTTYLGPEDALTMTSVAISVSRRLRQTDTDCLQHVACPDALTSLIVKLLQNLANYLPDALQCLDILLGAVIVLLKVFDFQP